jgi:hypothetical protein
MDYTTTDLFIAKPPDGVVANFGELYMEFIKKSVYIPTNEDSKTEIFFLSIFPFAYVI